jgi:hypothetical protein
MLNENEFDQKEHRRGRRHLDGNAPGEGQYLPVVAVTLRQFEIEELEQIGNGNRSAAVRRLLEMYRNHTAAPPIQ